jgi:hypothetical protein
VIRQGVLPFVATRGGVDEQHLRAGGHELVVQRDLLRERARRWCMDRGSEVVNGTRTRDKCGRWATLVG